MAVRFATDRGRLLRAALALQIVAVGAAVLIAAMAGRPGEGSARYALIVLLAVAMGVQNATAAPLAAAAGVLVVVAVATQAVSRTPAA